MDIFIDTCMHTERIFPSPYTTYLNINPPDVPCTYMGSYCTQWRTQGGVGRYDTPLKISICSNYEMMTKKKKKGKFVHIVMIYDIPFKKILRTPLTVHIDITM